MAADALAGYSRGVVLDKTEGQAKLAPAEKCALAAGEQQHVCFHDSFAPAGRAVCRAALAMHLTTRIFCQEVGWGAETKPLPCPCAAPSHLHNL